MNGEESGIYATVISVPVVLGSLKTLESIIQDVENAKGDILSNVCQASRND